MRSHPQGPGAECQQRTDASNSWSVAARRRESSSRSQEATLGSRQAWDDPLQWVPTWGCQEMELPWLLGLTHWPCLIPLSPQQQEGNTRTAALSVDKVRVQCQGGRAGTRVTPDLPLTPVSHQPGFWAPHRNGQRLPRLSFWRKILIFTASLCCCFQSMGCFHPHAQIHLLHNISMGSPKDLIQKGKEKNMGRR